MDHGKVRYEQDAMRRAVVREARTIVREAASAPRIAERSEPALPWRRRSQDRGRR